MMRSLLAGLLCLSLIACSTVEREVEGAAQGTPLHNQARPNIIYILADDLGYGDLGCYGQTKIQTPVLDRLAANGLKFTDHYAGSTVCAPSRSVLLTGKHVGTTYIRGNNRGPDGYELPIPQSEVLVSEVLKGAGYNTAIIGKWGMGGPDSSSHPNAVGFDFFYGFLNHAHAHNHYPDYLWRNDQEEKLDNVVVRGGRGMNAKLGAGVASKREAYANDLFFEESGAWIAQQAKADAPFFLYLALNVPHANNEANGMLEHMPEANRPQQGQEVPDLGPYAGNGWRGPDQGQAAMITRMDRQIGELVAQLEALGIADDTLIMFTSDNGPHAEGGNRPAFFDANGPYRGIKRDLYDGGIRVPMITYWPGTISPATTDLISGFQDILPTFADLAQVDVPQGVNGISFKPTLLGAGNQPKHAYLYWEFVKQQGKQAVRMGKWKGVRLKVSSDKNAPIQLYDIVADPGETTDVSAQHPAVVKQIAQAMQEARTRSEIPTFQFDWEK